MKIADNLRVALSRAMEDAGKRRHEYLTLEHVLLALLHDPETADVIEAVGGKLSGLEKELNRYLDEEVETVDGADAGLGRGHSRVCRKSGRSD
jgi:ATP-dependent Clp protease ATP-binding subunit ClpA